MSKFRKTRYGRKRNRDGNVACSSSDKEKSKALENAALRLKEVQMNIAIAFVLLCAGCSQDPPKRFELMRIGAMRNTADLESPTVLFDHNTNDVLLVYGDGSIQNVGTFTASKHISISEKKP